MILFFLVTSLQYMLIFFNRLGLCFGQFLLFTLNAGSTACLIPPMKDGGRKLQV